MLLQGFQRRRGLVALDLQAGQRQRLRGAPRQCRSPCVTRPPPRRSAEPRSRAPPAPACRGMFGLVRQGCPINSDGVFRQPLSCYRKTPSIPGFGAFGRARLAQLLFDERFGRCRCRLGRDDGWPGHRLGHGGGTGSWCGDTAGTTGDAGLGGAAGGLRAGSDLAAGGATNASAMRNAGRATTGVGADERTAAAAGSATTAGAAAAGAAATRGVGTASGDGATTTGATMDGCGPEIGMAYQAAIPSATKPRADSSRRGRTGRGSLPAASGVTAAGSAARSPSPTRRASRSRNILFTRLMELPSPPFHGRYCIASRLRRRGGLTIPATNTAPAGLLGIAAGQLDMGTADACLAFAVGQQQGLVCQYVDQARRAARRR